jgi:two-component system cell cycle sensor histidine kinase/response regulator CckA
VIKLRADKNRRVLVIDDNRSIHDDFRKILSPTTAMAVASDATEAAVFGSPTEAIGQTQFQVDSAYQGEEGVLLVKKALAAGLPYAMAFVDVQMPPGLDGVDTTRRLWELDPNLQVVLCTAYSDYSWSEMFNRLGQRDGLLILKKPFEAVEAFQMAHALTDKWWLHQESGRKMEELESRIAERTQELAQSFSLLNATFESTADGIVVADLSGKIVSYNTKFADMWRFPPGMLDRRDAAESRAFTAGQIKGPERFLKRIKEIKDTPEADIFDEVELKDGRTFERYVFPQRIDHKLVGTVINWRDVTERKRAEDSLRLLGSAMEQTKESVMITDAELNLPGPKIIFVNSAFTRMTGYNEDEVIGKTPRIFQGPRTDRKVMDRLRQDLEHGKVFEGETVNYRKDGSEFDLEWQIAPLRETRGKITHFVAIQRDVTERKRVENALRESNEKFHQLADNITDAFWVRSPDMSEVQYVSPAFERIWGRSTATLYANPHQWSDFILPEDRERVVAAFTALTGGSRSLEIEYRIVRPDGEKRWVRVRGFQVRDATDKLIRHTGIVTDITDRKLAEEELLWKTAFLEAQVNSSPDGILVVDNHQRRILQNQQLIELFHVPKPIADDEDDVKLLRYVTGQMKTPEKFLERVNHLYAHPYEIGRDEIELIDGRIFDRYSSPVRDKAGKNYGRIWAFRDITERKRLEAQLFQAQKMETVGKLAGGIAHEFNSLLTAIIGQSELLIEELPAGGMAAKGALEIRKAADRSASLTRQLLAYGRKQFLRPDTLDLNQIIFRMDEVLRQLMTGESVDINLVPGDDLRLVKADPGQIEQVIMNMVLNASEAMPNGGKLTLETANVSFDQESVNRYPELKPGDYVMLAITDTGTGMTPEVRARVFEPFFTTKGVGQGTGLGLSTCYGIVKQSGGHISVYSELAHGATFKIYLPQVERPTSIPMPRLESPGLPHGTETILLVEDDPALREMAATLLKRLGYKVLAAGNGVEALSLSHQRESGRIDLLFTDIVMPHMNGRELSDRVRVLYPHTRILFTSAYTETAIVHQGVLNKGSVLLQKPFTPSALALKVREILDQPIAPAPDAEQKSFGFSSNEAKKTGDHP